MRCARAGVARHEGRRPHFRSIWLERDGWSVGAIDQRRLPHEFVVARLTRPPTRRRTRSARMLVRGAPLIGATAAYGMALAMRDDRSDAGARSRLRTADRDAADRDQPEMGARRDDARAAAAAALGARAGRLCPRRRDRRGGCRDQPGDRPAWPGADRDDRGDKAARRARQRPDPLQRRLARDGRLGHRDGADLSGARSRPEGPCLGRRDPAAQSGRLADRLGTRPSRRAAHGDPRQHRRPSDAAPAWSISPSSAPTG